MKVAVSGKGGVGKSTLSAAMSLLLAKRGRKVLAVDADPDANLAAALGVPRDVRADIVPISEQKALVEERTGAEVKKFGQMFQLNPVVSDVADRFAYRHDGVALLVLGAVERGGGGCACPESVLLRALVSELVLYNDEALILDMEAGVEHLGRATARGVDCMLVVVEPGQRSIDCAHRVREMAAQIGLSDVRAVANKVHSRDEEEFIRSALEPIPLLGAIPFSETLRQGDRDGVSVLDAADPALLACFETILARLEPRPITS